ncbi:MAG: prenyltransferase/squalene oxidase repeat-containing protein [Planctomycetota bacterium]
MGIGQWVGIAASLVAVALPETANAQDSAVTQTGGQLSPAHYERALLVRERAIEYLLSQQDDATGGWRVPERGPAFPAITGLVLIGLTGDPAGPIEPMSTREGPAKRGFDFVLSNIQPDGGIYDAILANYNTAISLAALPRSDDPAARAAIPAAQAFLKRLQYHEDAADNLPGEVRRVDASHPFYGGVGYGGSGRPDGSNMHMFMWGLEASGVDHTDPAVQRAIAFLERIQMDDRVNDMDYAEGSRQGGFIYATGPTGDQAGVGESKAGTIEETLSDGSTASRLRAYGSMTYAGFKSYAYAKLPADDVRVAAAWDWIRRNYTLAENPGIGTDGFYYYMLTFARALDATGEPTIDTVAPDGSTERVNWANDLVDRLADLQRGDGSFRVLDDRWMENDPVLITAYCLVALGEVLD